MNTTTGYYPQPNVFFRPFCVDPHTLKAFYFEILRENPKWFPLSLVFTHLNLKKDKVELKFVIAQTTTTDAFILLVVAIKSRSHRVPSHTNLVSR
ncbi:hypothetical protein E4U61_003776 [Claviceps capensis]|nr:hypothetical protein E4U61_003776 [Claviceps capensis]